MLKGLWLWNDPEKKIILKNMLEREKKPLKEYVEELERDKNRLGTVRKDYNEKYKRISKGGNDIDAIEVLAVLEELEQAYNEKVRLLEESKKLYNRVLGEKQNLEDERREFKYKAYESLKTTAKYIIETSPISEGNIRNKKSEGQIHYTNTLKNVSNIIENELDHDIINPIGVENSYKPSTLSNKFNEIQKQAGNPLKGKGFVYDFKGNDIVGPSRVTVIKNNETGVINKNSLFGRVLKKNNNRISKVDDDIDEIMSREIIKPIPPQLPKKPIKQPVRQNDFEVEDLNLN
jgi:hypothetical protein